MPGHNLWYPGGLSRPKSTESGDHGGVGSILRNQEENGALSVSDSARYHYCWYGFRGEKHWHGATPTNFMEHVAIAEILDGKFVEWLEKVTDQQYKTGA